MDKPTFSVIIPVYNQQGSIAKIIESVVTQSYDSIEIIVVNDGSTDGSLAVCREYATRDRRIKLIDKPNGGLPMARKTGLEAATGCYVHHLDGGDYVAREAYATLYDGLAGNDFPDILVSKFNYVYPSRVEESISYPSTIHTPMDFLRHIWTTMQYHAVWQYVHKHELSEHIAFDKRLTLKEDLYYTTQAAYAARDIVMLDKPLYAYVIDDASMANAKFNRRSLEKLTLADDLVEDFMREKPEYPSLGFEMTAMRLQSYATAILNGLTCIIGEKEDEFREAFRKYPRLERTGVVKRVRKLFVAKRIGLLAPLLCYYKMKGKVK